MITGGGTGLTYQPDANYCNDPPGTTPDTFTYTLNGGSAGTVAVTVTCVDDPPVGRGRHGHRARGLSRHPDRRAGQRHRHRRRPDDDRLGQRPGQRHRGDHRGSAGAHTGLTYQPDANYCNSPPGTTPDTFTYTLNGGSVATVSVTVTCVDDPPVAVDDTATVIEDAAATAIAVLANDTDIDGGPKTIASASDPANGTVVLTGGSPGAHTGLTYQPDPNYCNSPPGTTPDTFTYTLNGGSTATVSVTVTCVPDPATLVNSAGPLAYTENDPATAVDAGVAITNPDGLTVTAGSVSITTGFQSGQDVLDWVDNNLGDGITEGASTAQTVVLTGSGTAAQYAAALAAVTYVNTSENPSTATRTVTFAITAGVAASDTIRDHRRRRRRPTGGRQRRRDRARGRRRDGRHRAHQRHRRRRRDQGDRLRDATRQRHRRHHRRRHRAHLPARPELLQQPARHHARHVHLHAQRRLHGHGVGDRHLRQRRRRWRPTSRSTAPTPRSATPPW